MQKKNSIEIKSLGELTPLNEESKDRLSLFESFAEGIKNFFTKQSESIEKKILVLDIDETMVHSSYENPAKGFDFIIHGVVHGATQKIYVKKRPYLDEFLTSMNKCYEICTYTSSLKEYSDQIIEKIDPKKILISKSLCRHNCVFAKGAYIKDLTKFKINLRDILIIDNCKLAYLLQRNNGLLIKPFIDDEKDLELFKLMPFLKFLSLVYDIRPIDEWKQKYDTNKQIEYLNRKKNTELYYKQKDYTSLNDDPLINFSKFKEDIEKIPLESINEEDVTPKLKYDVRFNVSPDHKNTFIKVKADFLKKKNQITQKEK